MDRATSLKGAKAGQSRICCRLRSPWGRPTHPVSSSSRRNTFRSHGAEAASHTLKAPGP